MASDDEKPVLNPGYPLAQLSRALRSSGAAALRRVRQWTQVITGMSDGSLSVGSRTPVSGAPAWATPEVVHGGFATGSLAAGGPLLRHELDATSRLPPREPGSERLALNEYYLSDAGRTALREMLREGTFRVHVPEEAALLAVTWLRDRGEEDRAARVVEAIQPFFGRLRFYPVPHPQALRSRATVHLEPASAVVNRLRTQRASAKVERMAEALSVWLPMQDRVVALLLETVDGEVPHHPRTASSGLLRSGNGQPVVAGGWPCRRFPEGWAERARGILEDYREARKQHTLCGKPDRRKENFFRLRGYLAACANDPGALSDGDVSAIRKILASCVAAHGVPGSEAHGAIRAAQSEVARAPTHRALAGVVARRLTDVPPDEGVPDVLARLGPLTAAEGGSIGAAEGTPIPEPVSARAKRCLDSEPEVLVAEGIVTSAETLARLVPPLTAHVRGTSIPDPELRRLFEQTYVAFRGRRSLLLLDLASQVKLGELPWIAAIEPWVGSEQVSREAARRVLARTATLALRSTPHTIVPNRLVTELRALASAAGLTLPLVNELACDIFMGAFAETFLRAGQAAGRLLSGSLYERYYGVPFERVLGLEDVERKQGAPRVSPGFARLCEELAGTSRKVAWSVARNGTVIEQAQIVTTHNLAALFAVPEVAAELRPLLPDMADRCFDWVCRQLETDPTRPHALRTAKNAAYAWRQMIFYLSLCGRAGVDRFFLNAQRRLASCDASFREVFAPVVDGLRAAAAGERLGPFASRRIFLGWSLGPHWVLARRE